MESLLKEVAVEEWLGRRLGGLAQQEAGKREGLGADAGGEDARVTGLAEVLVGDVLDQTGDELLNGKGEGGIFAGGAVLVAEGDGGAIEGLDAVFGQDGAFAIAAHVTNCGTDILEAVAKEDVPFFLVELGEVGIEGVVITDGAVEGRGLQTASLEEFFEGLQDGIAPHGANAGVVEVGVGDPAVLLFGETAAGDDDVEVGIPFEIAAEGVEDREDARPVSALLGEGEQGVVQGLEEGVECGFAVELNPVPQFAGQGKDEVLIGHIQEFRQGLLDPAIGGGLAAGGTEAGFAGVGNAAGEGTLGAAVFFVAPACAAQQHSADVPDDAPAQAQDIGRPKNQPSLAAEKDFAEGDLPTDELHGRPTLLWMGKPAWKEQWALAIR